MITTMKMTEKDRERLALRVLSYFREPKRTTKFYQDPVFDGYDQGMIEGMKHSLSNSGVLVVANNTGTNGAMYMLSDIGAEYLKRLEKKYGKVNHG